MEIKNNVKILDIKNIIKNLKIWENKKEVKIRIKK